MDIVTGGVSLEQTVLDKLSILFFYFEEVGAGCPKTYLDLITLREKRETADVL